ncbi:MAG: hypothetical protein D6698_07390 [Gammaproteobacteria bacterium]|nr:MAG: hypothetical protein D6698_07390 [Gammaproteobacteria bacterium]
MLTREKLWNRLLSVTDDPREHYVAALLTRYFLGYFAEEWEDDLYRAVLEDVCRRYDPRSRAGDETARDAPTEAASPARDRGTLPLARLERIGTTWAEPLESLLSLA